MNELLFSPIMLSTLPFTDLVEPMIEGTTNYFYLAITKIFIKIIEWFLSAFDASSGSFYTLLGITNYDAPLFNVFLWTGGLLAVFLFLFSAFVTLWGPVVDQKNNILELLVRFIITIVLIIIARPLCSILNDYICNAAFNSEGAKSLAARFSEEFNSGLTITNSADSNVADFLSSPMDAIKDFVTSCLLIQIICLIAIGIGFIKLLLKCIERYVLSQLLIIASPVASATYVSRTTSNILNNFIRMFITTLFTVLFCRVYLYMVCYMISHGAWKHLGDALILLAFMKQVENLEAQLRAMGLSVAQTGGSLLYSIGAGALGLGMMFKKGSALGGNILETVGAKRGNIGMASVGTSLKSLAHGQLPTKAQTIRAFGEQEGFAHAAQGSQSQYAKMVGRVADLAKSGQIMNLKNVPAHIQTDAVKQMFQEHGFDAFQQATGIGANEITSAHFNFDGSVTGMAEHNGQIISFKASTEADPHAASYGIVDNFAGGSRYITTTVDHVADGIYDKCDFQNLAPGQQSVVSTMTNVPIDNTRYTAMNISEIEVSNGILHGYEKKIDAEGKEVKSLRIATNASDASRSYIVGTQPMPIYNHADEIFKEDSPYSSIQSSLPHNVTPTSGISYADGSYKFDYSSPSGNGSVYITKPTDSDISIDSKAKLVNIGDAYGTLKVEMRPQKPGDLIR